MSSMDWDPTKSAVTFYMTSVSMKITSQVSECIAALVSVSLIVTNWNI